MKFLILLLIGSLLLSGCLEEKQENTFTFIENPEPVHRIVFERFDRATYHYFEDENTFIGYCYDEPKEESFFRETCNGILVGTELYIDSQKATCKEACVKYVDPPCENCLYFQECECYSDEACATRIPYKKPKKEPDGSSTKIKITNTAKIEYKKEPLKVVGAIPIKDKNELFIGSRAETPAKIISISTGWKPRPILTYTQDNVETVSLCSNKTIEDSVLVFDVNVLDAERFKGDRVFQECKPVSLYKETKP